MPRCLTSRSVVMDNPTPEGELTITSTQTKPGGNGVDVPSRFAAIDAVKGQPEIAQSDDDAGDARTAASGEQERRPRPRPSVTGPARTTESPMPGSRDRDVVDAHHSTSGRYGKPWQVWVISPPGDGGVRMSLLSVAGLPAWPLYTGCEAWTWT